MVVEQVVLVASRLYPPLKPVNELTLSATGWLLVSVTFFSTCSFTATLPNASVEGKVTPSTPVPLKLTVCGLLLALVLMVSVPAGRGPDEAGVTVSATVQLAPAATVGVRHVDDGSMAYRVPAVMPSEATVRETT
jgi:hypothetical protein